MWTPACRSSPAPAPSMSHAEDDRHLRDRLTVLDLPRRCRTGRSRSTPRARPRQPPIVAGLSASPISSEPSYSRCRSARRLAEFLGRSARGRCSPSRKNGELRALPPSRREAPTLQKTEPAASRSASRFCRALGQRCFKLIGHLRHLLLDLGALPAALLPGR